MWALVLNGDTGWEDHSAGKEVFYYGVVIHSVAIVSVVSKVLVGHWEYADTAWEQRKKLEERVIYLVISLSLIYGNECQTGNLKSN